MLSLENVLNTNLNANDIELISKISLTSLYLINFNIIILYNIIFRTYKMI